MRQREQWEMSKALEGKGSLLEARTPINAGTPRSRANWTCASWVSLGAIDNVRMSRDRRYAPQLATSTITKVSERKKKMLKLGHYITLHSALIIKLKSISETQFPLSFIFLKRQKKNINISDLFWRNFLYKQKDLSKMSRHSGSVYRIQTDKVGSTHSEYLFVRIMRSMHIQHASLLNF